MTKKAGDSDTINVAAGKVGISQAVNAELAKLEPIVGRWMTLGSIVADGADKAKISASDIYEWAPGGHFILHSAYGLFDQASVGGTEIIGYDSDGSFRTWFFDNQGKVECQRLSVKKNIWKWEGDRTRCTGTLSADGRSMRAAHEASEDGKTWAPSMDVILTKVT